MSDCVSCAPIKRALFERAERAEADLEASRLAHAEERELRLAAEAQRDRVIGLLHALVERHGALERQCDRIIEMLGAKP